MGTGAKGRIWTDMDITARGIFCAWGEVWTHINRLLLFQFIGLRLWVTNSFFPKSLGSPKLKLLKQVPCVCQFRHSRINGTIVSPQGFSPISSCTMVSFIGTYNRHRGYLKKRPLNILRSSSTLWNSTTSMLPNSLTLYSGYRPKAPSLSSAFLITC